MDTDIHFNPASAKRGGSASVTDTEAMKSSLIQCPLARLPVHKGIILPSSVSTSPAGCKNADIGEKDHGGIDALIVDAIDTQKGISTSYVLQRAFIKQVEMQPPLQMG